jgi:hypothetical protein
VKKMQRWFGLVAAMSILQLNVKIAYAACETGASGADATVAADGGSGTHHHESPSTPDASTTSAGKSESPSNHPVPVDCCQAMTSCGSSAIVIQGTTQLADAITPAPAIPACGKILHGRITAPEPPPPKA